MTFDLALQYLKQGYIIRRADWDYVVTISMAEDREISMLHKGKHPEPASFTSEDILAEDWSLVL